MMKGRAVLRQAEPAIPTMCAHMPELRRQLKPYLRPGSVVVIDEALICRFASEYDWLAQQVGAEFMVTVQAGESLKSLHSYSRLSEHILQLGIHRLTWLIAIGGGSVTDAAGFLAATLLRGLSWIAIPTTLVGMIDAAIGGKVGLNAAWGKNLLGAFYQPLQVLIGVDWLTQLPADDLAKGYGELIKYGLLDAAIAERIIAGQPSTSPALIERCAALKYRLVMADPFEQGGDDDRPGRSALNLGHTLAHGLEMVYELSHSMAVMLGLLLEPYLVAARGGDSVITSQQSAQALTLLGSYELDELCVQQLRWLRAHWHPHRLEDYMWRDKKRRAEQLRIVLVTDDQPRYHELTRGELQAGLEQLPSRFFRHHPQLES